MANTVDDKHFYVWFVTKDDSFLERLGGILLRQGFGLRPLSTTPVLKHADSPTCVVSLCINRRPRNDQERSEYTVAGVYAEVVAIMKRIRGQHLGIIVTESCAATWNFSNVSLQDEQKALLEDIKKVN